MTWRTEFPDFVGMPQIPRCWEDVSYHHDEAPSFAHHDGYKLMVLDERGHTVGYRFQLYQQGPGDGWVEIYVTDHWGLMCDEMNSWAPPCGRPEDDGRGRCGTCGHPIPK